MTKNKTEDTLVPKDGKTKYFVSTTVVKGDTITQVSFAFHKNHINKQTYKNRAVFTIPYHSNCLILFSIPITMQFESKSAVVSE